MPSVGFSKPVAESHLFAFPRMVLNAQICVFSPKQRNGPAFCLCSLAICKDSPSLPLGVCTGSWSQGQGVHVWVSWVECWVCLWGSWWDLHLRHLLWFMDGLSNGVWKVISRVCIPLMSSKNSGCCSPSHFLHSHTAHLSILDGVRKNGTLWQHPAQLGSWVFTHMLSFSLWD